MQNVLAGIESNYDLILNSIVTCYGVDKEIAKTVFAYMGIHSRHCGIDCNQKCVQVYKRRNIRYANGSIYKFIEKSQAGRT